MSKFDEKVALYKKFMDDRSLSVNEELLKAVTKGLGPSIYKKDAETVSGTDAKELETVKKNFLIKKLGLADNADLDKAIDEVLEKINELRSTGNYKEDNKEEYNSEVKFEDL